MAKPELPIDITDRLRDATGGAEAQPFWLPRPPMSPVQTGFGSWERSMRERGLL